MYTVELDPLAENQRDALPVEALAALMELRTVLEVAPWSGTLPPSNPDANMLSMPFGDSGLVTYIVLEQRRLVYIVRVTWV